MEELNARTENAISDLIRTSVIKAMVILKEMNAPRGVKLRDANQRVEQNVFKENVKRGQKLNRMYGSLYMHVW